MWFKVAKIDDIRSGCPLVETVSGKEIAFFLLEGQIHAIENKCGHRGGPLADGYVESGQVRCPWHAWLFDIRTGQCVNAPGFDQKSFKVKTEAGEVYVEV